MNLLDFYLPEEILVALSLLVLLFVLTRIFWKPLMKVIDDRQKSVDDMLKREDDAKQVIAEMEEQRINHIAELERMTAEKLSEARERANREYDRILAEAEEQAHNYTKTGEEKARLAYEESMNEAREAIISLAMGAASILTQSSMDSERNRELIESMLTGAKEMKR